MSRLNFAPIGDAFILGSDQIKKTQDEIAKLKQMIAAGGPGSENSDPKKGEYTRIGKPDVVSASFDQPTTNNNESLEMSILKIINHPKFDDIVKSYVLMKKPDWILNETNYRPAGLAQAQQENNTVQKPSPPPTTSQFRSVSKFGASSSGGDDQVGRFIIFILLSLAIYAILTMVLKST